MIEQRQQREQREQRISAALRGATDTEIVSFGPGVVDPYAFPAKPTLYAGYENDVELVRLA